MLLGAHQSVAGGPVKTFARADEDRCETLQIFTKNKGAWHEPTLDRSAVEAFREARAASRAGLGPVLSHASYLVNLCAKDQTIRARSRSALLAEVLRCEALGIEEVVFHPGAHVGLGVERGIEAIVEAIAWVVRESAGARTGLLIENTAGQGTCLAGRFEEIAAILTGVDALVRAGDRLGLCFDTCHAFAAGYDLRTCEDWAATRAALVENGLLRRIRALHLNDSKGALGSRLDRHARIGEGEIGVTAFAPIVADEAFARVAAVLETPPADETLGPKAGRTAEGRGFHTQIARLRRMRQAPEPRRVPAVSARALLG
jgi:deoxyribonuclease-4